MRKLVGDHKVAYAYSDAMSFNAYLSTPFSHTSEAQSFDALVKRLTPECAATVEPHYLIGNVMFDGDELDAIYLKPGCISVIEMKNYGGRVHFSENGDWYAGDVVVRGTRGGNPFRQVRGYKFTLLDYLKRREGRILKTPRNVVWHHIQGMVLFGQQIHFDEHLPPNIKSWFQICDHRTVARDLCSRHSAALRLEPSELAEILRCLELNDGHRYAGLQQPTASQPVSTASPAPPGKLRVVIHNESGFRESWLRANQAGTLKSDGAVQIQTILDELRRGINALSRFQSSADGRVPGSTIYTINPRCQLLLFRVKNFIFPWFVGEPEEVADWLAANEGITLVVDGATQRIISTVVGKPLTEGNVEPPKPTVENLPLLARLPSLDLATLITKPRVRKNLLELTEESSETDIVEVLELVEDEGLRLFLFDVINLIRKNDLAGAEARIRLPQGDACPVEDAASLAEEAVESGANSDQILELKQKEELKLILAEDFHAWLVFLHQDQKLIAEAHFDRPAILTGVSGSGKTCILVHRARHLARKYPGERIGVMTLNRALADLLKNLVQQLCSEEERRNIHVMAFYDYFRELLHDLGPESYLSQLRALSPESRSLRQVLRDVNPQNLANEVDVLSGETSENTWDDFFDQNDDEVRSKLLDASQHLDAYRIDASRYLREECTLVRSALTLTERENYLDGTAFPREGRAIPFQPAMRKAMGNIVTLFEEWMLAGGVLDVVELTQAVTPLWPELRKLGPERRFRCLLVDEFQDFSTLDLRLLLHVPTSAENGLFLAGDTVQKILVKKLRLHDAALGKGNVTKQEIKKNYRNSRQILKAASKLANHYCRLAQAQGEEVEILDPELALRETCPPFAVKTDDAIRKAWEIALEWLEQGATSAWTVCIATAAPDKIPVASILSQKPRDVKAKELTGDFLKNPETLVVGTTHDLKGFEFRLVLIIGCDAGLLPPSGVPVDEAWREALRLYVAMTRARDQVYLLYQNEPSEFLRVMEGDIIFRELLIATQYEVDPKPSQAAPAKPASTQPRYVQLTASETLDQNESCESVFDDGEKEILHKYFAKHVHERPGSPCESFREWLRPCHLKQIEYPKLAMIGRKDKRSFESLRLKFIRFNLS